MEASEKRRLANLKKRLLARLFSRGRNGCMTRVDLVKHLCRGTIVKYSPEDLDAICLALQTEGVITVFTAYIPGSRKRSEMVQLNGRGWELGQREDNQKSWLKKNYVD